MYFSCFLIVFLTGLQSYFSTIVFSRRLYHSGVELPIVSSSQKLGSICFLSVFRRKRLDSFCRNCCSCLWFAFSLWTSPQPNSEASLQTNNALFTIVCLLFVQIMFVDQILGLQVVRAWLPCVDLPWCPAPPPLRCKPAAELDRCSLRTATPGPNTRMRVTLGMIDLEGDNISSSPQSQLTSALVPHSSARALSPPFATCSTAWTAAAREKGWQAEIVCLFIWFSVCVFVSYLPVCCRQEDSAGRAGKRTGWSLSPGTRNHFWCNYIVLHAQ